MSRLVSLALLLSFSATSHAWFEKQLNRIDGGVTVLEWNQVSNKYEERPTFTYLTLLGKDLCLKLEFTPYFAPSRNGNEVYFCQKNADEHLAAIAKFQEWNKKASEAGDAFTKDIAKTKTVGGFRAMYEFHSAAAGNNLLVVYMCVPFACIKEQSDMPMSPHSVSALAEMLVNLRDGKYTQEDPADKYK